MVFASGPERCWQHQLRALIPTPADSRLMSKATILASGPVHPQTLKSRNNLAYAYESAGDLERAIQMYKRPSLTQSESWAPIIPRIRSNGTCPAHHG
jgi:hypothetical protein